MTRYEITPACRGAGARRAFNCRRVLPALLSCVAISATAATTRGPDELYWLPPPLVTALAPAARGRLVSLAADVVAGRTTAESAIESAADVLADAPAAAVDVARARLRFLAGDIDASAPEPNDGALRAALAVADAQQARTAGADPAAAAGDGEQPAEAELVLVLADLDRGRLDEARTRIARALARCDAACSASGHADLARATLAFFDAKFDDALAAAHAALEALGRAPRRSWLESVPALTELSVLLMELKDTEGAARALTVARTRADELLPPGHPYAFAIAVAEFGNAIEDYESSVAAERNAEIRARYGAALAAGGLAALDLAVSEGAMHWLRNDYAAAAASAEEAIAGIERTLGERAPRMGDALAVRALSCSGTGDHDCALAALRRALELRESLYAFPHPLVAEAQNNLAVNLHDLGRYDLAEPLMVSVLEIDRAYYGADNEEVASDLHNLASLYRAMGEPARAVELLKEALAIDERELGPGHQRTGFMVHGLGQAYLELGDYRNAYASFRRALDIHRAIDPQSRSVPIASHNLAIAAIELGEPELARELLGQALVRYENPDGPDWRKASTARRDLARALAALGDAAGAQRELMRATDLAPLADAPELHWKTFMALAEDDMRAGNPRAAVFFGKLALDVLQQLRATQRTLSRPMQADFLRHRANGYRTVVSWLVDLGRLAEAHAVRAMLDEEEYYDFTRRQRFAPSHAVPFTPLEREQRARLTQAWDAARAKGAEPSGYGEAVVRARAAFAALGGTPETGTAEAAEAGRAPPPAGSAYVDYVVEPGRVDILVQTATGRYAARSDVPRGELRAIVFELRETLSSPQRDPRPHASRLHALLLAPVAERLRADGVTTLWVVPDDVLRYLPFAALYDGERYAGERWAVARVSAGGPSSPTLAGSRVAAFAVSRPVGGFAALPGAEAEVDAIVRSGAGDARGALPGDVWLNEAFDRAGLRSALGAAYPIVHVASHFRFEPGNELDSFLLLGTGERLPLSELRTGDYPFDGVDLLTMSGCDTVAASEDANGREIDGFAALAASKGARYIVATLWSVDDEATAALMARFYAALAAGADPVRALAESRVAAPHAHPFYWAPFVIWGAPTAGG